MQDVIIVDVAHNLMNVDAKPGEAKPASVIPVPVENVFRKGIVPLFKVKYTSNAGNTAIYGVFWNGHRDGTHRLGLRKLTKKSNYINMAMYTRRYCRGFEVDAAMCKLV